MEHKTLSYSAAAKYICYIVYSNPLFKVVLLPIMVLSILAGSMGIFVLDVIRDIEVYLATKSSDKTPFELMIRYMTTPFIHYAIAFCNEIVISYFISTVIRRSYCAFTKEYILINYEKFHSLGSGQIHAIIQRRLLAVEEFMKLFICHLAQDLCFVLLAFVKVYRSIDHRAFYANLAIFGFYVILVWIIIKIRVKLRLKYNDRYNNVSNKCYGILVNYDVIKSFTNEELEMQHLDKKLKLLQKESIAFSFITAFADFTQKNALVIPNGYILYLGMSGIFFTKLNNFSGFSLYNKLFLNVKAKIANISQDTLKLTQYMTDISDTRIIEEKLDIEHRGLAITNFRHFAVFKNVDLSINNSLICSNINLSIEKGDKIAIVGKNGCGKSTFINLLLRMRDYNGSIKIDGIEMREICKEFQRNFISYIPQNPSIQEGTVLENLKYGNNNISDEKVIEICKEFGSHEIFSSLINGYSTEVGEMGKFLSGGQKQRLSFLRGIIKNGDMFIFDEHTSNLDQNSQNELINYIFTKLKYKTSLVILHKNEHLNKFDKILRFNNGNVQLYDDYAKYLEDCQNN